MLTSTDDIVGNAILIEAHKDKYKGTTREDKTLLQTDVFLSAFSDGKDIVPVKMEVKEFKDKNNSLYVIVTLEKIKTDKKIETEIVGQATQEESAPISYPVSNIRITEIISKINPNDGTILKYLPDQMLDKKQLEGKRDAIAKENEKISKLKQNVVLPPVSGISNSSSVGNTVFGPEIIREIMGFEPGAHIDELAETSIKNNKPYEADTKNHAFAKDGFEYRTAYFQDFDG